eukprot:gene32539-36739_t
MAGNAFLSDVLHISAETNGTVKDIFNALKGETTLIDWKSATELKFSSAGLKYYELKWLSVSGLRVCQSITTISIDNNVFEDDSMKLFCELGIPSCKHLSTL